MKVSWLIGLYFVQEIFCIHHDFKGFDDSILFGVNWPGSDNNIDKLIDESSSELTSKKEKSKHKEVLRVKTDKQESYDCHIPEVLTSETTKIEDYDGPSPIQLLKPLFTQKICSYRLESYWSYEVCHGRYVRQYHEEREGKMLKTQEYFLGHWSIEKQKELETALELSKEHQTKPKLTKVEGVALPSVEMVMDQGTMCDLSGQPRKTRIQYVCYSHGKHEVYSFKEISTCEYEIIVLSPLLCEHPQFKPFEAKENTISCVPVGDTPKKPRSILAMEAESLKSQHQSVRLSMNMNDKDHKDVVAVLKVEKIEKDGETHLKFEIHPLEDTEGTTGTPAVGGASSPRGLPADEDKNWLTDDSPVRAFLNGETCLDGGTGWWRYEFCYGKQVSQYHVDRNGERTTVVLGKFDEEAHLEWIRENRAKAPKPVDQRVSISHLYSGGDICDKTGKPRQTEVKLKCLENSSSAQVSLYLLEPRTCHYILGVESPLICNILPLADENGLIKTKKTQETKFVIKTGQDDDEDSAVDKLKNL